MTSQMRVLTVKGIALDSDTRMPIVLLTDTRSGLILPLRVGPAEASAIIIEIEGVHPPRPLTHDLITDLFLRHGFVMRHIILYGYDRHDDKFQARLSYTTGKKTHMMEVRPSDGIAIALRLEAPILASTTVMEAGGIPASHIGTHETYHREILYLTGRDTDPVLM
jgi:uncharacterized protein